MALLQSSVLVSKASLAVEGGFAAVTAQAAEGFIQLRASAS